MDKQAVIRSLQSHKPKSVQHLIDSMLVQIEEVYQKLRHPDFRLEIVGKRVILT